jgi:glycine/D-amino acid oxidase-like deaminating enzyme
MIKTIPYWTDKTSFTVYIPLSDLPQKVDVAVIGSGYTGLNAALTIAGAGGEVVVLEQETIGWGASSRNGGMTSAGMITHPGTMKKNYGLEKARQLWQWSLDAVDHVDRIIEQEGIECDFVRQGNLFLASKPAHFDHLRAFMQELQQDFDYPESMLVSKNELSNEIGSRAFYGGLLDAYGGGLDPAKYTFGLAFAATRYGARMVEKAQVTGIRRIKGGFLLSTSRGQVAAKEVVVATNGYTTGVFRGIRRGVFPAGSYIIVTEPLPLDLQDELSPNNRMFEDSKNFLSYFRLTVDGRALLGGRSSLSTELDLLKNARILHKRMLHIWPQLEGFEITHSWTGKLGLSFDMMPHAGRLNGVWFANGYCGHGISIGSYLGHEIGQIISGQKTDSLIMEIKQPRYFLATMENTFLPLVTLWYRILDLVQ